MNNEDKPLTAEEMVDREAEWVEEWGRMVSDANAEMIAKKYAEQQTSALREELDDISKWEDTALLLEAELKAVKKELKEMKDAYDEIDEDGNIIGYGYWKDEYFRMQESAMKYLKQRDEVTGQRDEAVEIIKAIVRREKKITNDVKWGASIFDWLRIGIRDAEDFLSRIFPSGW